MDQVVQVLGSLFILAAFVAAQRGWLATDSRWYLMLNLIGAAVLAVDLGLVEGGTGGGSGMARPGSRTERLAALIRWPRLTRSMWIGAECHGRKAHGTRASGGNYCKEFVHLDLLCNR